MAERDGATSPGDDARAMVRNMADQQKHKVASRLGGVAQALRDTAKTLERHNADAGRYADLAARQVDRVTHVLEERPVEELVEEAENFARRQPLMFISGAIAAGFLFARVVKSGKPSHRPIVLAPHLVADGGLEAAGGQP